MLSFVNGDFFEYRADIRVNTVNCVGVMGAGVALTFKKRFPDMFYEYTRICKMKEIEPGKPHVWHDDKLFSNLIIINMPTKIHWKKPSKYEYIIKNLEWLKKYLTNYRNVTVTLPALGCGHGGLEWKIVKQLIKDYLHDSDNNILVFEPENSVNFLISENQKEELFLKNISILLTSNESYPTKLRGKTALELLYKGEIGLLAMPKIHIISNPEPSNRENRAINTIIKELPKKDFALLLVHQSNEDLNFVKELNEKGYSVILIIASNILEYELKEDLNVFVKNNKLLLISRTKLNQTLKRNEVKKAIELATDISDIVLINISDIKVLEGMERKIKNLRCEKFFVNYWNSDVKFFGKIHVSKIGMNKISKKANVKKLLESLILLNNG